MHTISLTALRRTPGPALDVVRRGGEVVVTEDGAPRFRIVPVTTSTRFEQLMAAGVLHEPVQRCDPHKLLAMIADGLEA